MDVTGTPRDPRPGAAGAHLFLYDGVCGLCNRVNRLVLRADRAGQFDFAALQGPLGRDLQRRFGVDPDALGTFYVAADYRTGRPALLSRSRAALFVVRTLGWPWKAFAVLGLLPTALLDAVYDLVARHRYALFGRFDTCPLPPAEDRRRFIDR